MIRSQLVVAKASIEAREVDGVVEQVVQRVLEGAGEELARQIDGQQLRLGIDVLVPGHGRRGREETTRTALARPVRRCYHPPSRREFHHASTCGGFFYNHVRRRDIAGVPVTKDENKTLVRRYYEEVVSTGAVDQVGLFVSPDYVEVHDNRRYEIGLEGVKEHIRAFARRIPIYS
jgi:hypothetical protein